MTRTLAIGLLLSVAACEAEKEPEAGPDDEAIFAQTPGTDPTSEDGIAWEFMGVETTRAARQGFSWAGTTALSEVSTFSTPVNGANVALPPVHYAQIYIKNADQLRELEELGIHTSTTPLFDSEWPTTTKSLTIQATGDEGDFGGLFVYGLILAPVYNALRAEALAGEVTYDALILREVPAEAAAGDGTVRWRYLLDNMERFAPISTELTDAGEFIPPLEDAAEPGTEQKRLGRRLRRVIRKVAEGARVTIATVRATVAAGANLILKSKTIQIATKVNDRTRAPLVRAWDDGVGGFGKRLQLTGTRVSVTGMSRLTEYATTIDANGIATVKVPKSLNVNVCFIADSPAAKFEAGLVIPVRHCWLKQDPEKAFDGTPRAVGDLEFYDMAQVIDAREYASTVLGFRPPKVTIQVGWLSEILGKTTGAFTPCLAGSRHNIAMANAYVDALNLAGAVAGTVTIGAPVPVGLVVEFFASTDIVLTHRTRASRNTVVHEYGHFFFCSLMDETNKNSYNLVWSQVITPKNLVDDASTPVKALNEGIADWFVSQATGSTNYIVTRGSDSEVSPGNSFMNSSGPGQGLGLEMNFGGPACSGPGCDDISASVSPTTRVISKVTSILHDALDRRDCGTDKACRDEHRSDAAPWTTESTGGPNSPFGVESSFTLTDIGDEEVALSPADIKDALVDFASQGVGLSYENVYGALTKKMRQRKYSEGQICQLFALHEPDGRCSFGTPPAPTTPPAAPTYTITATPTEGGGVTPPNTVVNGGGGVTLLATPKPGFRFTGYTGSAQCTGVNPQLIISNVTSNVSCTANFIRLVNITFTDKDGDAMFLKLAGTVLPSGAACSNGLCTTDAGGEVTLREESKRADERIDSWTCTESNTGTVLSTASDADPNVIKLRNLQNDWSCSATIGFTFL